MIRKFATLLIVMFSLLGFSGKSAAQGYQIKVKINPVETQYIYLIDNQFSKKYVLDTCRLKAQKNNMPLNVLFKSNVEIPFGLYTIECNGKVLKTIALGGKEKVEYTLDLTATSSPIQPTLPLKSGYSDVVLHAIAHYEVTTAEAFSIPQAYQNIDFQFDTDSARLYWKNRIFTHCFLDDENLLHMPLDYDKRLLFYFTKCVKPEADSLKQETEWLLNQADSSVVLQKYYLNMLLSIFRDADHACDEAIVFIFEKYCSSGTCEWLDPTWNRIFKNWVARINKLIKGATVPVLEAYDMTEKLISTDSLPHQKIVLWFWDPDCDHCIEETPKLFQKYKKLKDKYNFEVYAISITEDLPRWKAFIEKHGLNWINVSYAMGTPNYDFIDYFDLVTTPAIYLIDKTHRIITHSFNVLDLEKMLK
ncbi:MAG: TlpA family protein disulfide reductase [Bacteroidales bacterium]|nr:TlpA family protein disulfide reductase [Bacteroidales bacterium]